MDVTFEDQRLALIETPSAAETRLSVGVIQSARRKLTVIRAAPDERTLRNWKSLHCEKLNGTRDDHRSIRLNSQWRMVFRIDTECSPNKVTVIAIEDYHWTGEGGMEHSRMPVELPGDIIKEELTARGWSQRDLAYVLGMTEQQLSPMLSGKRAITPDMGSARGSLRA